MSLTIVLGVLALVRLSQGFRLKPCYGRIKLRGHVVDGRECARNAELSDKGEHHTDRQQVCGEL